jgi:hypothetical protein
LRVTLLLFLKYSAGVNWDQKTPLWEIGKTLTNYVALPIWSVYPCLNSTYSASFMGCQKQ